jgi:hypothetical protein
MTNTAGTPAVVSAFSHETFCAEHPELGVLGAGDL